MRQNTVISVTLALAVLVPTISATCETGFEEDFSDGIFLDGNPVQWELVGAGNIDIVNGALASNPQSPDDFVGALTFFSHQDVSVQMQVSFPDASPGSLDGFVATFVRDEIFGDDGNNYYAGIDNRGKLYIVENFEGDGNQTIHQNVLTGLDPISSDVAFRVDVIGNTISATAWELGMEPPSEPQAIWTDPNDSYPRGNQLGFFSSNSVSGIPAIVHSFSAVTQAAPSELLAGDADQNLEFDQQDLVRVLLAGKYLTGEPATWGDGDWDGAARGEPGHPPVGNRLFDHIDIVAALSTGTYLTGPYAAIGKNVAGGVFGNAEVVYASVPEPSSMALAGLCFSCLIVLGYRRRAL